MISSCFLSMWISNTATTIIMLPVALSIISLLKQVKSNDAREVKSFSTALIISIAFSATIGGNGTLVGSPPNALLAGFLQKLYQVDLSFVNWMKIGIPFMILSFITGYYSIVLIFRFKSLDMSGALEYTKKEHEALGKLSRPEKIIIFIILITVLLWIFKTLINNALGEPVLSDTLIMMMGALSLFVLPGKKEKSATIVKWSDMSKIPWGVLYLFGGALCLANMLHVTGIIEVLGSYISSLNTMSPAVLLGIVLIIVLVITEVIGGTAISSVFIPTVLAIAVSIDTELLYFAIPITLSTNVAFLTPMGTAPNAIVFSEGDIKISDMVKAGIGIKIISFILLQFFVTWWVNLVLL